MSRYKNRSDYASWPTKDLVVMRARAVDRMTRSDEAGTMIDMFAIQEIDAAMAVRAKAAA